MPKLLTLFVMVASTSANAWWTKGHEQVADIAWSQLEPSVKKEIGEILKEGDVDFRPASDKEADVRAAFRKAAGWADWVKDHKEGLFEETLNSWNARYQPGYDPADPDREAHRCKRWHYFDIPIKTKGVNPGVEGSNALIAMTTARYEIKSLAKGEPRDRKMQCWWLYWTTHVIGDLHQPLHCVSSFEHEAGGDAGGNLFKLGIGFPDNPDRKMNLHALWDSAIEVAITLEKWPIPTPEAVTDRWTAAFAPTPELLADTDVANWIEEGAKLAQDSVYAGLERDGKPSEEYTTRMYDLCRRQAVLAGYRLAKELNSLLAP